jgi:hypothetical protein
MKELLNGLLISQVAEVSGANPSNIGNWLRFGQLTRPQLRGKHRRFTSRETIEVILMQALIQRGIKASVAGPIAVKTAYYVFNHYTDDWAEQRGDEIVMGIDWALLIDLKTNHSTCGRAEEFTASPGDWMKIDLAPIMGAAFTRARRLRKRLEYKPLTADEALAIASEVLKPDV